MFAVVCQQDVFLLLNLLSGPWILKDHCQSVVITVLSTLSVLHQLSEAIRLSALWIDLTVLVVGIQFADQLRVDVIVQSREVLDIVRLPEQQIIQVLSHDLLIQYL